MLRSCYSTMARFIRGDTRESDIEWNFTDLPPIGIPCVINSLNYVNPRPTVDDGGLGEIPGRARPWLNSAIIFPPGVTWPGFWGRADDFLHGGRLRTTDAEVDEATAVPACCWLCALDPVTQQDLQLHMEGWESDFLPFDLFNGDWILQRGPVPDRPCFWSQAIGSESMARFTLTGHAAVLQIGPDPEPDAEDYARYEGTITEWPGPFTLDLVHGPLDPAWGTPPPSVTIMSISSCDEGEVSPAILTEAFAPILTEALEPIDSH